MPEENKPKKGETWGIRIKLGVPRDFGNTTTYIYRTKVSCQQEGDLFVTNQALQDRIKERGFRQDTVGTIKINVVRVPKIVYMTRFLPLGPHDKGYWSGLGMAASVELQVINDIIKRLGRKKTRLYKYLVGHYSPSDERIAMYEKMGLKVNQPIPLEEYQQILAEKVGEGERKASAKPKPKPKPKLEKKKSKKKPTWTRK